MGDESQTRRNVQEKSCHNRVWSCKKKKIMISSYPPPPPPKEGGGGGRVPSFSSCILDFFPWFLSFFSFSVSRNSFSFHLHSPCISSVVSYPRIQSRFSFQKFWGSWTCSIPVFFFFSIIDIRSLFSLSYECWPCIWLHTVLYLTITVPLPILCNNINWKGNTRN